MSFVASRMIASLKPSSFSDFLKGATRHRLLDDSLQYFRSQSLILQACSARLLVPSVVASELVYQKFHTAKSNLGNARGALEAFTQATGLDITLNTRSDEELRKVLEANLAAEFNGLQCPLLGKSRVYERTSAFVVPKYV